MSRLPATALVALLALAACKPEAAPDAQPDVTAPAAQVAAPGSAAAAQYFDQTGRDDAFAGGVRMVNIRTPDGIHRVWTRRTGNNPTIKVLLLHGGPGGTHDAFAAFDSYFPGASIEYYMYDQLGSGRSDKPGDPALWQIDRFVDEVEQVRQALKLDRTNFYLLGQSWGGILAIEYALKHQQHLRGLVVSNMMSSIPAYNTYAKSVLMPQMPPAVLAEVLKLEAAKDYANPRYEALLMEYFYTSHVLRLPPSQWPEPVVKTFSGLNRDIYVPMQGPSEMGASGLLANWDRSADLKKITVPTLVVGAAHDTMDPKHMQWMATQFPQGRFLLCPNGSHLAMYDDQQTYMQGVIGFLREVDGAKG